MIRLFLEFAIAFRYLRAKKQEAFISIVSVLSLLGISIGVGALVVVMSVMNGYRIELTNKLKGFNSDVTITGENYKLNKYTEVLKKIKNVKGIYSVAPVVNEQSLIIHNNRSSGIMVKGIKKEDMPVYPFLFGHYKKIKKSNGIMMGRSLGKSLGVKVGDTIKLVSPKFETSILGPKPKIQDFYVEGFFNSGLSEYDSAYVVMTLEASQKFFEFNSTMASRIEIFALPNVDSYLLSTHINQLLFHEYQVLDWQMMNANIFEALKTERVVMFIILAFIILVAAFNIISSLVMLVTDKVKEIAILRTIGFSQFAILRIFLISGMTLGAIGTMLGVCGGLAFSHNINEIKNFLSSISGVTLFDPIVYYLDVLPSHVDDKDVVKIIILSLALSFISTIYPAYKASKLSPAAGLKHD